MSKDNDHDVQFLPVRPSVSYSQVSPNILQGMESMLSMSVLLGNESPAAKAAEDVWNLDRILAHMRAGIRTLYAYRGVTRNINEARGDVDPIRLSLTWVEVLLPGLKKIVKVTQAAVDAQETFVRLIASGPGVSNSGGNLAQPLICKLVQLLDTFIVMDSLLNSKQTLNVDLRWLQSALELQRQQNLNIDGAPSKIPNYDDAMKVLSNLNPLLSRPSPFIHSLSTKLANLPQPLVPLVMRSLIYILHHCVTGHLSASVTFASLSFEYKQSCLRCVVGILVLLCPSVSVADISIKTMRSFNINLNLSIHLNAAEATGSNGNNGASTSSGNNNNSTPTNVGHRLLERSIELLQHNRIIHTIGDAFVEPGTLLRMSPYFTTYFSKKHHHLHRVNRNDESAVLNLVDDNLLNDFSNLSNEVRERVSSSHYVKGSEALMRENHDRAMWKVVKVMQFMTMKKKTATLDQMPKNYDLEVLKVSMDSLRLLNEWRGRILSSVAYKRAMWIVDTDFQNVVHVNNKQGKNSRDGLKNSTSSLIDEQELVSIFHLVTFLKGLSAQLLQNKHQWLKYNVRAIVKELYKFLFIDLDSIFGAKLKKKSSRSIVEIIGRLKGLFNTLINTNSNFDNSSRINMKQSQQIEIFLNNVDVSPARLPPLLQSIQCLMWELISLVSASSNAGSCTLHGMRELKSFINRVEAFSIIVEFDAQVCISSSLHDLWFREMYIEHSFSIQLPISLSVPWLLVNAALSTNNSLPSSSVSVSHQEISNEVASHHASLIRMVFVPLEIYNDCCDVILAARDDLTNSSFEKNVVLNCNDESFRSQVLYDELEAEVDLVFDQLLFTLSTNIFKYYKLKASTLMLEQDFFYSPHVQQYFAQTQVSSTNAAGFSNKWREHKENTFNLGKDNRSLGHIHNHQIYSQEISYKCLLNCDYQLLGRRIDVRSCVRDSLQRIVTNNIEYCLQRLEGSELSYVIEFEMMLNTLQFCHQMIEDELHVNLDNFEDTMLTDTSNESTSGNNMTNRPSGSTSISGADDDDYLTTTYGRIATVVLDELINDVMPNFAYNDITKRFVRNNSLSKNIDTSQISGEIRDRPPIPRTETMYMFGSKALNLCYSRIVELHSQFIGCDHLQCIIRLLKGSRITSIIECIVDRIDDIMHNGIATYAKELYHGLPCTRILPTPPNSSHTMSSPSSISSASALALFYQRLLQPILLYPVLYEDVMKMFVISGNGVALIAMFDIVMMTSSVDGSHIRSSETSMTALNEVCDSVESAMNDALRLKLDFPVSTIKSQTIHTTAMTMKDSNTEAYGGGYELVEDTLNIVRNCRMQSQYKTTNKLIALEANEVDEEKEYDERKKRDTRYGISMLCYALKKLQVKVKKNYDTSWSSNVGSNDKDSKDNMDEEVVFFYNLWSSLLFCWCCPPPHLGKETVVDEYGDGFFYCGTTMIKLMKDYNKWKFNDYISYIIENTVFKYKDNNEKEDSRQTLAEDTSNIKNTISSAEYALVIIDQCADIIDKALSKKLAPIYDNSISNQMNTTSTMLRYRDSIRNTEKIQNRRKPPPIQKTTEMSMQSHSPISTVTPSTSEISMSNDLNPIPLLAQLSIPNTNKSRASPQPPKPSSAMLAKLKSKVSEARPPPPPSHIIKKIKENKLAI